MHQPIIFLRMDMCPRCKNLSLEIYDYWNNPMGYRHIIDAYTNGETMPVGMLNKREFYTIRCKKCGQAFPIIWRDRFPFAESNPMDKSIFRGKFKSLSEDGG